RHLLKFTLATAIANGTIQWMVREQELGHAALRFLDLFALSGDNHAVRADDRAGRLQLRHLFDAHETHATRGLQRQVSVITEGRNIETLVATHVDQTCTLRNLEVFTVNCDFDQLSRHLPVFLCVPLRSSAPLRLKKEFTAEAQRNAEVRRENLTTVQ